MSGRSVLLTLLLAVAIFCMGVSSAEGVDKFVTANANISTLVTANDTVLIWTGNFTVTVDATTAFTVAGVNAGGFTATIDFTANDRKVLLGNTAGNVVFQTGGGEIRAIGAGTGAQSAGFLIPANTSGETVEIQAVIDDSDNANHWIIGNNTLLLNGSPAQVGTVTVGLDGGIAKIDVDQTTTIKTITPTGDFTLDVAVNRTVTVTNQLNIGANTMTLIGGGATSNVTATAGIMLDNASSVLSLTGSATINNLDTAASTTILLADGASLTLTDAIPVGANTLTITGTTGSAAETITATGGFTLDNALSQLKVNGDSANPIVISKVAITGADLTTGKIDIDESATITTLTVSQNATIDVASGKTLSGQTTLNAAKTLILNNKGTLATLSATTAAGTIQVTDQAIVTTLTNSVSGTTVDINESATISTFTMSENATIDVLIGKTLTTVVTVPAGKILTSNNAGTISTVTLNGLLAELNMTVSTGTVTLLNVNVDGGVLDVDFNCTITECVMASGAGDLTVENASFAITSSKGFKINNNTLKFTQSNGSTSLAILGESGGTVDIDATTTITALTVSASGTVDVATSKTLSGIATVSGSATLTKSGSGLMSTVDLNGPSAKLTVSTASTVTNVNVRANGGILDINEITAITLVNMVSGSGDLTIDVAAGKTLTTSTDVNNNRLTLAGTGVPGGIVLDTAGGVLDVDADSSPTTVLVSADTTFDVASSKTLTATVSIGLKTLTLAGSGTLSRVDAIGGMITANANATITDLRLALPTSGSFTLGGSGSVTIGSMSNSTISSSATITKNGTGVVTISGGVSNVFAKGAGIKLNVDAGGLIVGSPGSSDDITFDDDGDELILAAGATLTTYGSFTAAAAGANINLDALPGSVVNLSSNSGVETISATADNDFRLLGTVNIDGDNGDYTLAGAFTFQFADVNVNSSGSFIDRTPSARILFVPGSRFDLSGSATLTIDGQDVATPITLGTTDGSGAFTLDRGNSNNVIIKNVNVSNATYTSSTGDAAIDDLDLSGVVDGGGTVNWFAAAEVPDNTNNNGNDNVNDNANDNSGNDGSGGNDNGNNDPIMTEMTTATVDDAGSATATAVSGQNGTSAQVDVSNATAGSVIVTIADGNLRDDFVGIENETALPVTMRVENNLSGEFVVVVQLCYTADLLTQSGIAEEDLVLYTFTEPDGPWVLAGSPDQYLADMTPTDVVGDHGFDSQTQCVWAVRDQLSDFAAGVKPAGLQVNDGGNTGTPPPAPPRLCGIFGMISTTMMMIGLVGLGLAGKRPRH